MKKLMSVEVRGADKTWSFLFYDDPKYLDEWRDDGLEVNEIMNVIPMWVVDLGLTRIWTFFQDMFNFRFFKK